MQTINIPLRLVWLLILAALSNVIFGVFSTPGINAGIVFVFNGALDAFVGIILFLHILSEAENKPQ